ncbi:MAG: type I-E CRISPR-associated protein Cas7/Cse4/CasC [Candidatus Sumerlaeia bacterium]|nr:type I-E CRISPR-associated protein Cas7/Cse4/CasC [Candidatus Sumerlaeia bacterium]
MIVELHLIQNFAPSCLNRDDVNSPKECEFGGFRRARISSQCLKRAIRWDNAFQTGVSSDIGIRTKFLMEKVKGALIDAGRPEVESDIVAQAACAAFGSGVKEGRTSIALYLGKDEIGRIVQTVLDQYDIVLEGVNSVKGLEGKKADKAMKDLEKLMTKIVKDFTPGTQAADIALFGRMIAEGTHFNVDAAAQVAHALSTHQVVPEMDFFTAVDDLQPKGDPGAGMLGTQDFNSPCLYRYSAVHRPQLVENLAGDEDLANEAIVAFLRASILAIPSAKQNSHAAHQPPTMALAVVRESGPQLSLANAFVRPIRPRSDQSLVEESVSSLAKHWGDLIASYGAEGITAAPYYIVDRDAKIDFDQPAAKVKGMNQLLEIVSGKLPAGVAS